MTFLATMILACIVAWFVLVPLWRDKSTPLDLPSARELIQDQSERCAQVLRDLELDFSTQKISSDDYRRTKLILEAELAQLLEQSDRAEKSA